MSALDMLRVALFGTPPSEAYRPSREGVLAAFGELERRVNSTTAGIIYYATGAERAADTARPVGTIGKAADEDDYYRREGAGWVVDNTVYEGVASIVQPIVDEAIDARDEFRATTPRLLGAINTLGETIQRTTVAVGVNAGSTAITRGARFPASGGGGTFIVHDARPDDVAESIIPAGTKMRMRAVYATNATEAELGLPSESFATRILYSDGTAENNNAGDIDTARTRYVPGALIVETTFTWAANIASVGHLSQFNNIGTFSGTRDMVLMSHEFIVDELPATYGISAADIVRQIETERLRRGYAVSYSLADAMLAGLGDATPQNRHQFKYGRATGDTKIALPANTDLIGEGPTISTLVYAGSATLTDATRTDFDPLRLRGNHTVRGMGITTKNSNYCLHSESANAVQDWVQTIEDCVFRHNGNEGAFANGGLSQGGRHVPAMGTGMSSGSTMYLKRTIATSFKGGGGYWHDAQNQTLPCRVVIETCTFGGDSAVDPDIQLSTLGSTTVNPFEMYDVKLTNGVVAYAVSSVPSDPMKNYAAHTDIKITGSRVQPHIFTINDPGRALRVRALTANGPPISISGEVAAVLFDGGLNLSTIIAGDTDTKAAVIGAMDVAGHSIGTRVDLLGSTRRLIVTVGGSSVTYNFPSSGASGTSNAAYLTAINTAIASIAVMDLVNVGAQYRPEIFDQEVQPVNVSTVPIHQGTMVLLMGRNSTCRNLEPSDFSGGSLVDPLARIGVALAYIPRNRPGRVQHRGYINWEHLIGDGVGPNLNDGFTVQTNADGVHGTIKYAGNTSSVLRCIQAEANDGLGRYVPRSLLIGD